MVTWWRCLQAAIFIGTSIGMGLLMSYLYDTSNFLSSLVALVVGGGFLALMVLWVISIQDNIDKRKRN